MELAERALEGTTAVYFAAVPLGLCVPYDVDYRPDLHLVGAEAIRVAVEAGKRGDFHPMIAYPRGKWFIIADDYIPLFAALEGRADYVPCWVLGEPSNDQLRDVQGPIRAEDVRKIFGRA